MKLKVKKKKKPKKKKNVTYLKGETNATFKWGKANG